LELARAPVHVYGNTYYVGVEGLSSVLVTTSQGWCCSIGGLPQSVRLIAANLVALGQRLRDVKYVLTSHAHFDHVGGVAALQRRTRGRVVGTPPPSRLSQPENRRKTTRSIAVAASRRYGSQRWRRRRTVRDGETITLGDVTFTAHLTPGHTPGATTWSWRSCEGAHCVDVVYADSLNPISDDGFRFTDHPGLVEQFRRSIEVVEGLPCDVIVTVHPDFMALDDKLATRGETVNPFVEPSACRRYAGQAQQKLDARLAAERAQH